MFISEIEDLEDIIDTLVFEDEPSIFTEEYAIELVDTALHLMDEYMEYFPHVISEPNFHDILLEEIKDTRFKLMRLGVIGRTTIQGSKKKAISYGVAHAQGTIIFHK